MPTIYTKEKRKQQILIIAILLIILVTVLVWWSGFFRKISFGTKIEPITVSVPLRDIRINFEVLESDFLREARPFEIVKPADKFGRNNPFVPVGLSQDIVED